MDQTEYQAAVERHVRYHVDENYCVIAINEEAGEIAGWYKKYKLRGNPTGKLTKDDLKGEIGDVLYYITRLAAINGWDLSNIMDFNIQKLDDRTAKNMRMVV